MLVVSVLSLKGGVGKTSVVLGLAGAAADRGLFTLVVDLDPQANATSVLAPAKLKTTIDDVLRAPGKGALADAVVASSWNSAQGEVDLVGALPDLEGRNAFPGRDSEARLRIAMRGLTGYDLVLLDCPPTLGELTRNALVASRRALVVTEPSLFALQGAERAVAAVDVVRGGFNLTLRTSGIVVNRMHQQSAEHRFRLAELRDAYGAMVLDPPLPDRSAVQQAAGAGVPVQQWPSAGAKDVSTILDGYLGVLLHSATEPDLPLLPPHGGSR